MIAPRSFRIYDRSTLQRTCELLAKLLVSEEHPILIEVAPLAEQRTGAQNRLLHAILRDVADAIEVDGQRFTAEAWKEMFRRRCIGTEELVLPGGERIERGISTTTLTIEQMGIALDQFQAWLASEFGYLPEELAA